MLLLLLSCGDKNADPAPLPVGWHAEEGWGGQCWYPPDFAEMESMEGISARRMARQTSLEAMKSQWSGGREDGVSFPPNVVEDLETILLGRPEQIEVIALKNLEMCKQVVGAGGDAMTWQMWLGQLPEQLTEGECLLPFTYTVFDYLEIGGSWQMNVPLCAGDVARIVGTSGDKFRITNDGPWINVDGIEGTESPSGADWPCTLESCREGMLIGRFVTDEGVEEIFPVGVSTTYRAPNHGTLSVSVNDSTYYDNTWYKSGGIIDHTGITISPAE
jgi:hypothetical protein